MSDMTTTTEMTTTHMDHPNAWSTADIRSKDDLALPLQEEHLRAIEELLEKTRHLDPQAVTREDFDHPVLNSYLADAWDRVMHKEGIVIIQGITRERFAPEDFERIFWGFGLHWGIPAVQSPRGERLGHVRHVPVGPDNPVNRAYRGKHELTMHTDTQELVALMSVQKAKSGGYSSFVSALTIHNEIVANRPDLLPALYEGYYFATNEAQLTDQPITPYKVPVFCAVDGVVSCVWKVPFIYRAGKMNGGLPPKLEEGLEYFQALSNREDLKLHFLLEPGEIAFWNNYTVLHSRTAYEDFDEPEKKRLLLRLWLDVPNGRPVIPVYHRDLVAGT